ncbi:MAG: hypothetical protein JXN63_07325 [Candidatus Delongbacteria bacterium]|nr:hypothetical protein [Candidatus Delongbacteria bacterium]
MKIAIDIMGGETAPDSVIEGITEFNRLHPETELILCTSLPNHRTELKELLKNNITVEFSEHAVTLEESPYISKKDKPDNTIAVCIKAVEQKKADCAFSCGNSGAVILNSTEILGLKTENIPPALMSFIPMYERKPLALFDVGAMGNYNFAADKYFAHLKEAADVYSKIFGSKDPEIKLLNIGTESWKGTTEHKTLYRMLDESEYNFSGNIEGDGLLFTDADIIICDGLSGNIALKLIESFNDALKNIYNNKDCEITDNFLNFLVNDLSYEKVGAAFLLGLNGKVALGHGKSGAGAVKAGLEMCLKYSEI